MESIDKESVGKIFFYHKIRENLVNLIGIKVLKLVSNKMFLF